MITGAGRGIGRAYAALLAARGASVVVNDLGGSMEGDGADGDVAAAVAREIERGVADAHDVSSAAGAEALIARAIDEFGRVDIVINNAGIMRWTGPPEVDAENLAAHIAVHVNGSFNVARAAWPHMLARGYGRIVMTTSSGVFGLPNNTAYATAKGAVIGLTRSLATAGAKHGIRVNAIAPAAFTRMAGGAGDPEAMAPGLVAPMAAFLAHEECPVTGEIYAAGAGRFARMFIATNEGYVNTSATIEDVAAHFDAINDVSSSVIPTDLMDWSAAFMKHLRD